GAPLYAIHRAQLALLVGPFIPDRHPAFLQPANVGVAAQKPQQLDDDRAQVQLLGGDQRKTLRQVEPHLVSEHRAGARTGAVGFQYAMFVDLARVIFVLVHERVVWGQAATTWMECVISAVLPSVADAAQYFAWDSRTARSTAASGRLRPVT